ncbi:MAG TPA: PAS domain S-box protein [Candidatus Acidoferrum sp.]|nr:PAS domain S-box protein [Candidatus Acidoferrum sp.]
MGSILPLLLFLYASHRLVRKIEINSVLAQSQQAADTAGRVIEGRLTDARLAVESFAADPVTVDVWAHRDIQDLTARLREAHDLEDEVTFWSMYDSKGLLRVGYPESGADLNRNVASSDWFAGAEQSRTAQVSTGSRDVNMPKAFVITVAAPIACGQCGVLATTYTPQTIRSWLVPMQLGATNWISVVDHNGIIIVAPDRDPSAYLRDVSAHESVRKAIMGQSGAEFVWQDGKQTLVSRHPLSSLGWAVLVEIPLEEIDKELWKYERPVGLLTLLFYGIALVIGSTVAVLYRRLRESREHVQQILTASHDAFIGIDERGTITDWNPQAEVLFGYSSAEAVGQPLHATIIPPRHRDSHVYGLKRFLKTGKAVLLNRRLELAALHQNGREFPIELSISHVSSSGRSSFNAFIHDISERKRAQEEILNLNRELSREIAELEARNKELEAFSYSVSHDVRAPLRHIIGFSGMLSEEFAQDLTPAARGYLEKIQNGALRLQQMVDDLLSFSRLGAQELKLHPTDLAALVKQVISELQLELDGRKINFEVSSLPNVECDASLIKQVFWNLIANAIKFTAARASALIEIGHNQRDGTSVFFIRDNGAGFNMKYADKLFAPFQRLHSQEEFAGTGVGLAIVQRVILKHKGRIWAEAQIDVGATFFFTLEAPLAEPAKALATTA